MPDNRSSSTASASQIADPFRNIPWQRPYPVKAMAGAILVADDGQIILQRRDNIPEIDHPGRLAMFGGHVEDGETFDVCLIREIHEETGLVLTAGDVRQVATFQYHDPRRGELAIAGYLVRGVAFDQLVVTEGQAERLSLGEIGGHWRDLTPVTALCLIAALDTIEREASVSL